MKREKKGVEGRREEREIKEENNKLGIELVTGGGGNGGRGR